MYSVHENRCSIQTSTAQLFRTGIYPSARHSQSHAQCYFQSEIKLEKHTKESRTQKDEGRKIERRWKDEDRYIMYSRTQALT